MSLEARRQNSHTRHSTRLTLTGGDIPAAPTGCDATPWPQQEEEKIFPCHVAQPMGDCHNSAKEKSQL